MWTGSRKRRSSSQTPLGCIARAFLMPSSRDFGNGELYYFFFSFSISFPFPRVRERWGTGLGCPRLAVSCLSAIEDGSRERSRKKKMTTGRRKNVTYAMEGLIPNKSWTRHRNGVCAAISGEQREEEIERTLPSNETFIQLYSGALLFMFPFFLFLAVVVCAVDPLPPYTFATTRPCYAAVKARAETAMSTLASFALMSLSRAPVSDHGQQKGWRDGLLPIGPSSVAFSTARIPPLRALPFSPRMAR